MPAKGVLPAIAGAKFVPFSVTTASLASMATASASVTLPTGNAFVIGAILTSITSGGVLDACVTDATGAKNVATLAITNTGATAQAITATGYIVYVDLV